MSYEEDYLLVKVQELEKRIEALEAKDAPKSAPKAPRQPKVSGE